MDEAKNAAAVLNRYTFARAWFRKGSFDKNTPLDEGIFIDRTASPPVIDHDATDPDFLAAIYGQDDAIEIEADDLAKLRKYVLEGTETFPLRRDAEAEKKPIRPSAKGTKIPHEPQ